jgi:hypothetical protein
MNKFVSRTKQERYNGKPVKTPKKKETYKILKNLQDGKNKRRK